MSTRIPDAATGRLYVPESGISGLQAYTRHAFGRKSALRFPDTVVHRMTHAREPDLKNFSLTGVETEMRR
jgi:hypothetical protein